MQAHQGHFYPRSPCGERPIDTASKNRYLRFLSTLSLRRATDCMEPRQAGPSISIHALLAESDQTSLVVIGTNCVISIHALLAESDLFEYIQAGTGILFLSTLSLRRATRQFPCQSPEKSGFLSTLSLRRATQAQSLKVAALSNFYPRSPCGERPRTQSASLSA